MPYAARIQCRKWTDAWNFYYAKYIGVNKLVRPVSKTRVLLQHFCTYMEISDVFDEHKISSKKYILFLIWNQILFLYVVHFIIMISHEIYFLPFISQTSLSGLGAPQGEMISKSNGKQKGDTKCTQKTVCVYIIPVIPFSCLVEQNHYKTLFKWSYVFFFNIVNNKYANKIKGMKRLLFFSFEKLKLHKNRRKINTMCCINCSASPVHVMRWMDG